MSINEYIINLESAINSFPAVASYNLNIDRKTEDIAFISGQIEFRDGSVIDFKEFIESSENKIEKFKYGYNFRRGYVVFLRYDNAPDPNAKSVKTFPHHKHLHDGKIVESHTIELTEILEEIGRVYTTDTETDK